MKAEFKVIIEGNWFIGDKRVTKGLVIKDVRHALNEEFEFLAKRVSVKPVKGGLEDKIKNILEIAKYHLKEHATEYSYPGQHDFIKDIESLLKEMK